MLFTGGWTETNDGASSPTAGDININNGELRFQEGTDGGEVIQRSFSLVGATAAQLTFTYEPDDLDAGETVTVEAFNGTTWVSLGTLGGDSNGANLNFSANLLPTYSQIRFTAVGNFEGGENLYIDNVNISVTAAGLNAGVDTINGDGGDDTIIWNANSSAPTDGRDLVNGGTEGTAGDTFVINGNASSEAYRIYTRGEFLAANAGAALNAATEIVVTRNGTDVASIIAELSEIEEIRINGIDPSGAAAVRAPATPSPSSATSPAPACGPTPSRSMARQVTTRSTSRRWLRPIASCSSPTAATTRSSAPCRPRM